MSRRALYAQFEAVPGAGDELAELVRGYAADVTAEPGNLRFDAHRLEDRPDHFFVYEEYASEQAFRAHVGADYCTAFNRAISSLVVGGGSRLTWLTPIA